MKKKYPDNIVYNYDLDKFDAHIKSYPTSIGSQNFDPIKVDKTDIVKANNYFNSRLNELKEEYKKLIEEYNWTSLVYKSDYNFQPIIGHEYHLYLNSKDKLFLSLIKPTEWKHPYVGTFKLLNNGKWEKI
tara:strand:- start:4687 stop:5076 length:390 start_codon:yes stop_codon:yes gene_type:complete